MPNTTGTSHPAVALRTASCWCFTERHSSKSHQVKRSTLRNFVPLSIKYVFHVFVFWKCLWKKINNCSKSKTVLMTRHSGSTRRQNTNSAHPASESSRLPHKWIMTAGTSLPLSNAWQVLVFVLFCVFLCEFHMIPSGFILLPPTEHQEFIIKCRTRRLHTPHRTAEFSVFKESDLMASRIAMQRIRGMDPWRWARVNTLNVTTWGSFSTTSRSHKTCTQHVACRSNSPVLEDSTDMKMEEIDISERRRNNCGVGELVEYHKFKFLFKNCIQMWLWTLSEGELPQKATCYVYVLWLGT